MCIASSHNIFCLGRLHWPRASPHTDIPLLVILDLDGSRISRSQTGHFNRHSRIYGILNTVRSRQQ